jgi:VWFA-related protein
MRVRSLVLGVALFTTALAAQTPAPQPPQQPVFRAGVDLLTVDATVVDREGRQVTDLKPPEFQVEVDGDTRPVVSAEYVKLVDDTPRPVGAKLAAVPAVAPDEAYFSTNSRGLVPGRSILILVDQGNIRVGQGRFMMRSAVKFVDSLMPADRVAMVAIPQGALVDFTSEHEKVREALLATVGLATPFKGRFHISLSEAIATVEHSDINLRNALILRECGSALLSNIEAARCEIEVEQEAAEIVNHQRQQTQASLRGMREVLKSLGALDGPKTVILISEGLVLDGLGSETDEIAAIAADVRATLEVMLLDVPQVDVTESQRPTTPREDRDRQVMGLEMIAGNSRGTLHRIITSGDNAFVRINRSMAGYYLLGVEARPRDRDGRRHRIQVKTTRRGVTVYSRRGFLATTSPENTSPDEAVRRALRGPLTINDLPMRMTTWTYKEPGGSRVRLLLAAEIERTADQPLDYTTGIAFVDRNNKALTPTVEDRKLRVSETDPALAVYAGSLVLDPGTYMLRFAVADSEKRVGSIERKVTVYNMSGAGLSVGDLIVAQTPSDPKQPLTPAVEPRVSNGRLSVMMEVYASNPASREGVQARLDVLADEKGGPLLSQPMQVGGGGSPEVGVLGGVVNTATLPPGRYFARATVTQGGKAQGHLLRPFRVVAGAAGADAPAPMVMPLPTELVSAMLANLPVFDRKELLSPEVMNAVLTAAERARPTAKTALASARNGKLGPAALEALTGGDQTMAAFLRGLDFFSQGQTDRALQQFQVAMQQAPTFAPTRLYLGAALAEGSKYREAAGLLQSVPADMAGPAPVARMAGLSWLHAGDASLAITTLEKSAQDPVTQRMLALAYVAANRAQEAMPLLVKHLESTPKDEPALLAGVYATYATHSPTVRSESLVADRARAQAWARTYSGLKGQHQGLVDAWIVYLQGAK